MCVRGCVRVYLNVYLCVCVFMYVCVWMCLHVWRCLHVYVFVLMCVHVYVKYDDSDLLVLCYRLDPSVATLYAGIPSGFSLVFAPLSGYLLDRFGHRDVTSELMHCDAPSPFLHRGYAATCLR